MRKFLPEYNDETAFPGDEKQPEPLREINSLAGGDWSR
jgi:hypothetical protein